MKFGLVLFLVFFSQVWSSRGVLIVDVLVGADKDGMITMVVEDGLNSLTNEYNIFLEYGTDFDDRGKVTSFQRQGLGTFVKVEEINEKNSVLTFSCEIEKTELNKLIRFGSKEMPVFSKTKASGTFNVYFGQWLVITEQVKIRFSRAGGIRGD